MKRSIALAAFAIVLVVLAAGLNAGQKNPPKYKALELKHFTIADGVTLPETISPQNFLNLLYDQIRTELAKKGPAAQIADEGASVPEADAADSVVVEGRITNFKKPGHTMANPPKIDLELDLYQVQGHALIKTVPIDTKLVPGYYKDDATFAKGIGRWVAGEIRKALK
jgi:hypothetical protein